MKSRHAAMKRDSLNMEMRHAVMTVDSLKIVTRHDTKKRDSVNIDRDGGTRANCILCCLNTFQLIHGLFSNAIRVSDYMASNNVIKTE